MKTITKVLAEYRPTKTYAEQLNELIEGSRQPQISPSNGAAATAEPAASREISPRNGATATAAPAASREMSPSNGAAATAAPAGSRMLDVKHMTKEHMSKIFGVSESKITRDEAQNKLKLTLEGFIEMEKHGDITVTFGAKRSIFGITTIEVNNQDRWNEVMKRQAKK
jgi:hypothetical protein